MYLLSNDVNFGGAQYSTISDKIVAMESASPSLLLHDDCHCSSDEDIYTDNCGETESTSKDLCSLFPLHLQVDCRLCTNLDFH